MSFAVHALYVCPARPYLFYNPLLHPHYIFEFFVHWLYHQRFPDSTDAPDLLSLWTLANDHGELKTANVVLLYVICDSYDIQTLQSQVMSERFSHFDLDSVILLASINVQYAFSELLESSPLCRYLIDAHCHYADERVWNGLKMSRYP